MEQRWKGNDGNIHAFLDLNSTKPDFLGLMYKRITTIVPNFYLDEFTTTFFFHFFLQEFITLLVIIVIIMLDSDFETRLLSVLLISLHWWIYQTAI